MFSVWWHIFQLSHSGENLFKMQSRIFLQNSQETFVEAAAAPAKKRCYLGNRHWKKDLQPGLVARTKRVPI